MDSEHRDLKFSEASKIDRSYTTLSVENNGLKECVAAFVVNVNRSIALVQFSPLAVGTSEHVAWVLDLPEKQWVTNTETGTSTSFPTPPQSLDPETTRPLRMGVGHESLQFWGKIYPEIPIGIEALLIAYLISMWTAFETLAGDLWIESVNLRPNSIGRNVFSSDASVTFEIMREYNYSIGSRLGDIAKRKKIGNFDDLDDLINAYKLAFKAPPGEKNAKPSRNLTVIFDKYYNQLNEASLIRNLLIHQAGRVDAQFKRRMKRLGSSLANLEDKSMLAINGELVSHWVGPVVECACELVRFVDGWLVQIKN